jgi:NAD-dependent dihydropyrimidine dehydrogenase PreA subunit
MIIDKEKCIGCGECVKFCTVSAIRLKKKKGEIRQEICAECGNCLRVKVCPSDAIFQNQIEWPRTIRNIFSDPISVFKETGVSGRGTEEMKTNDVTGRFKKGEVGFAIDVGRPNGGGIYLREVEKITKALAPLGVQFEKDSPLTYLFEDPVRGTLKKEILDQFVVSAIVECKTGLENCVSVFRKVEEVSREINTIFSVGLISTVEEDGTIPVKDLLEREGIPVASRGKTNVGLGRRSGKT